MIRFRLLIMPVSILFLLIFSISACTNSDPLVQPSESGSDYEALLKLADEDEILQSFEPNYNEDEAMSLLGDGLAKAIYPLRVGHKMKLVDRELTVDFVGDTAIGILTRTFEGKLLISASFDPVVLDDKPDSISSLVDTLIEKDYSTVITSNIKYAKFENTRRADTNWKIIAVSLPEGGTASVNIAITKMTLTLPGGEVIEIESPNDYYLERLPGKRRHVPAFNKNEEVTVILELESAYADTDFVSVTYGAVIGGDHHRVKKRFELISEEDLGGIYKRTYEQTWTIRPVPGFKHAIVNAVPKQVLYDDQTEVEENSWGIPYSVR